VSGAWHVVTGDFPPASRGRGRLDARSRAGARRRWGSGGGARAGGGVAALAERRHDAACPRDPPGGGPFLERAAGGARRPIRGPAPRDGDRVLAATWTVAADLAEPCRDLGDPLLVLAHGSDVTRLGVVGPPGLAACAASRVSS